MRFGTMFLAAGNEWCSNARPSTHISKQPPDHTLGAPSGGQLVCLRRSQCLTHVRVKRRLTDRGHPTRVWVLSSDWPARVAAMASASGSWRSRDAVDMRLHLDGHEGSCCVRVAAPLAGGVDRAALLRCGTCLSVEWSTGPRVDAIHQIPVRMPVRSEQ
jgi:hypothetical protein